MSIQNSLNMTDDAQIAPSYAVAASSKPAKARIRRINRRARSATPRGNATRDRILSATVDLLSKGGYAATNVQMVSELARVSRGSILHQFPTRLDLMAGVLEYVADRIMVTANEHLSSTSSALNRLRQVPDLILRVCESASGLALTEIQEAARWDENLAALIKPASEKLQRRFDVELAAVATQAGLRDPARLGPDLLLMIAAIRGLVIGFHVRADQEAVHAALALQRLRWIGEIESQRKRPTRK